MYYESAQAQHCSRYVEQGLDTVNIKPFIIPSRIICIVPTAARVAITSVDRLLSRCDAQNTAKCPTANIRRCSVAAVAPDALEDAAAANAGVVERLSGVNSVPVVE